MRILTLKPSGREVCLSLHTHRRLHVSATKQDGLGPLERPKVVTKVIPTDTETVYLEPFLRAFLLGVGSGALLEIVHVTTQIVDVVQSVGNPKDAIVAMESQAGLLHHLAPLFYADHAVALAGWLLFYTLDVIAIKAVLDMHKGDAQGAGAALKNLVTLPMKMLPVRLAVLKHFYSLPTSPVAAPAAQVASVQASEAVSGFIKTEIKPTVVLGGNHGIVPIASPSPSPPGIDRQAQRGLLPGQLDPALMPNDDFARRRKELADRRAYLYGFWYAAAVSEAVSVSGTPLGVDLLGRRVVLFREPSTGVVRCLDDACPHRGAPLSAGWVTQHEGHDCLVCPYHGWALDGSGHLRDVPAAEHKGEWPRRQIMPTHDVIEQGGFVWLWYGSRSLPMDARPPIPAAGVSELEDPAWKAVYGEIEFDCNHSSVFENAIDMAHIHYLHSGTFGNQDKPEIRGMKCTSDAYSVTATFQLHNKPASPLWAWTAVPQVEVTARAFLPSTSVISFTLGNGLSFTTFVNTVPVSANKSVNRFALVRNLAWDRMGAFNAAAWDAWARNAMLRILGEDKAMVERLRPDLLAHEYSVRADLPQVAFRKLRQGWVDMGHYRVPEGEDMMNGAGLSPDY